MNTKTKTFALLFVIMTVVGIAGAFGFYAWNTSMQSDIAAKQTELSTIENNIQTKQQAQQTEVKKNTNQALGISDAKKSADDKVAEKFFGTVFNWDSYEEYNKMRQSLISDYGLAEDSQFMQAVAPKVEEIVGYQPKENAKTKFDVEEVSTNEIDANNLNVSYGSLKSYLMDIDANGGYEYFGRITLSTVSTTGGTATRTYTVAYTVTSDSQITNLTAYGSETD